MTLKFNEEFAINPQSVESGGGGGGGSNLAPNTTALEVEVKNVEVKIEVQGE